MNALSVIAPVLVACLAAPPVVPLQNEPPAKILVDAPLAGPLAQGRVVIQNRAKNLHFVPVFGPTALAVSPRIGHIRVNVDDAPWVWADASGEDVIINGLPPGPHKVRIQLETANHQLLDQGTVSFRVPRPLTVGQAAAQTVPPVAEPPAKIVIDAPLAEPLARGVVFIPYRAENDRARLRARRARRVAPSWAHPRERRQRRLALGRRERRADYYPRPLSRTAHDPDPTRGRKPPADRSRYGCGDRAERFNVGRRAPSSPG